MSADQSSLRYCCAHHRRASVFTLPGASAHYPPDLGIEPVHLDIDLRVNIDAYTVSGVVTHTLRWRRAGAQVVELHALEFEGLRVEAPGHEITWHYDGQRIRVQWAEGGQRDEERALAIHYRVTKPRSGLFFSAPTELESDTARFAATDHETERARHWLPTIDLPSVRPTLAFHLRAASQLTILANGRLDSEQAHDDGTKTAHWILDQPCPSYLTCFAIGEFVEHYDGDHLGDGTGVPLAFFATREHDVEHLKRSFGGTAEIMRWMTAKLGRAFPYPKYYQFALPQFGGAMENISLVSWDDQFLLDESLAGEWGRLIDQINVHEMAHTWFGDLVVCRDYAHAWLKESWATYMEVCWFEDMFGRDDQLYELWLNARAYFREADGRYKRPIVTREFHSSFEMYDMHLYPGGAARLHTLRCMLGDALFWEGVRAYIDEFANCVVETDDFRRALERVSGRALGKFFDQWIHSPGYPQLEADFDWDEGASRATFTIKQLQVDASAGVGLFSFPLTLEWTLDGVAYRREVEIERARHSFAFEIEAEPEMVRIDPDFAVLHKLDFDPGLDKLETQLAEAPDVLGRILAGRELIKKGKRKVIESLGERWLKEPYWGVRLEWAKALGELGSATAVECLSTVVNVEQDHRVLEGLLRACMGLRDRWLADAVVRRFQAGLPHRAAAVAWEYLGSLRDKAPYDLVAAAAERESYNGFEQSGAFRGLAATRERRALDILLLATAPGQCSNRARPAAAVALGTLARRLERRDREQSIECLVDLLRDSNERVRMAAAQGLEAAHASEAVGALVSFRATLTQQEQVRVDRMIAGLRKEEPRLRSAEKELDAMRDKLRKLEERVEKLSASIED